jgi:hypothetical protein
LPNKSERKERNTAELNNGAAVFRLFGGEAIGSLAGIALG